MVVSNPRGYPIDHPFHFQETVHEIKGDVATAPDERCGRGRIHKTCDALVRRQVVSFPGATRFGGFHHSWMVWMVDFMGNPIQKKIKSEDDSGVTPQFQET